MKKQSKVDSKQKALAILHGGVSELMQGTGWRQALEFRSRFHNYSFLNTSLILAQCPDARLVADYRKWQELGRQVRKGEKSISILAPIIKKDKEDPDKKFVAGFRAVPVFDISQTDGEPVPGPESPKVLEGDGASIRQATNVLERYCVEQGIQLTRDLEHGRALGIYRPTTKSIALKSYLPALQELKTLTHELAHALLHDSTSDRVVAELEAESSAFLVCHQLGLDTSAYSFAYLAGWADTLETLIAAGDRACKAAEKILERLFQREAGAGVAA
ncbi:MAG: ArdC-like ssDNA-binding domain-containing protein [Trueperaceae bacterium]